MGSFLLWRAAASITDMAPRVRDAFDPKVMLLGGKIGAESNGHDTQNILGDLGLIRRAHFIAAMTHALGLLVMLAAYAWGAALFYLQFCRRASNAEPDDI